MTDYATAGVFTDPDITKDPYPYFEFLRSQGQFVRGPTHGVIHVTGYDEGIAIFRDDENFSAIDSSTAARSASRPA